MRKQLMNMEKKFSEQLKFNFNEPEEPKEERLLPWEEPEYIKKYGKIEDKNEDV